jgi:hypothetical protein
VLSLHGELLVLGGDDVSQRTETELLKPLIDWYFIIRRDQLDHFPDCCP